MHFYCRRWLRWGRPIHQQRSPSLRGALSTIQFKEVVRRQLENERGLREIFVKSAITCLQARNKPSHLDALVHVRPIYNKYTHTHHQPHPRPRLLLLFPCVIALICLLTRRPASRCAHLNYCYCECTKQPIRPDYDSLSGLCVVLESKCLFIHDYSLPKYHYVCLWYGSCWCDLLCIHSLWSWNCIQTKRAKIQLKLHALI